MKVDNFKKIITFLKWKWTLFLFSYIQVLVMGDFGCEFQKNCTVETPWKFEAKMTLFWTYFHLWQIECWLELILFWLFQAFLREFLKTNKRNFENSPWIVILKTPSKVANMTIFKKSFLSQYENEHFFHYPIFKY